MKTLINFTCLMALAIVHFYIGHCFLQAMESTKIADLGHNFYDVVCLMISIVFWLFGFFIIALTSYLNRNSLL